MMAWCPRDPEPSLHQRWCSWPRERLQPPCPGRRWWWRPPPPGWSSRRSLSGSEWPHHPARRNLKIVFGWENFSHWKSPHRRPWPRYRVDADSRSPPNWPRHSGRPPGDLPPRKGPSSWRWSHPRWTESRGSRVWRFCSPPWPALGSLQTQQAGENFHSVGITTSLTFWLISTFSSV